ncbi:MAG: hypothetical protein AAF959_21105 [Cyanobacteria bacterium P01_D01_bin.56]
MAASDPNEFIPVNGALNLKPSLGPIPGDQIVPWTMILLANLLVIRQILGLSWLITGLSICWGIGTWWILTGSDSAKFLAKFHSPPLWLYGSLPFDSPLSPTSSIATKEKRHKKSKRARKRLKIQR